MELLSSLSVEKWTLVSWRPLPLPSSSRLEGTNKLSDLVSNVILKSKFCYQTVETFFRKCIYFFVLIIVNYYNHYFNCWPPTPLADGPTRSRRKLVDTPYITLYHLPRSLWWPWSPLGCPGPAYPAAETETAGWFHSRHCPGHLYGSSIIRNLIRSIMLNAN